MDKEMQNSECRVQSDEQCSPLREKGEGFSVGFPKASEAELRGFRDGYEQGVRDMAQRLCKYYTTLPLPKTQPAVVEYNIRVLADELLEEKE